jgi:NADPH:quinone reductase-like Zn-dependent oxidoreductase
MKAIAIKRFVENYSDLQVSEVPLPLPNSADEILVDITHAGLNHVDLLYARGKHQNNHSGLVAPPFILGLEFAGIVASAPTSSRFRAGDHVWGGGVGAFAQRIVVKESALQRVPDGWSLEDAAGLGAATAPVSYGALVRVAKVQDGEVVLVHAAAGGLGVATVQIARAMGARVIGTVGSTEKAGVVRKLGVDTVIRYDEPVWEKKVLKATGGEGVNVVFDTVGLVEKSLRCLRYGGRIVVAGVAGLEGNMEKLAMNRILLRGAVVLGYVRVTNHQLASLWMANRLPEIRRKWSPGPCREYGDLGRTERHAGAGQNQACHLRDLQRPGVRAASAGRPSCEEGLGESNYRSRNSEAAATHLGGRYRQRRQTTQMVLRRTIQ